MISRIVRWIERKKIPDNNKSGFLKIPRSRAGAKRDSKST
jgi:hypothetical protein